MWGASQHGHGSKLLASTVVRCPRNVTIELGMCGSQALAAIRRSDPGQRQARVPVDEEAGPLARTLHRTQAASRARPQVQTIRSNAAGARRARARLLPDEVVRFAAVMPFDSRITTANSRSVEKRRWRDASESFRFREIVGYAHASRPNVCFCHPRSSWR